MYYRLIKNKSFPKFWHIITNPLAFSQGLYINKYWGGRHFSGYRFIKLHQEAKTRWYKLVGKGVCLLCLIWRITYTLHICPRYFPLERVMHLTCISFSHRLLQYSLEESVSIACSPPIYRTESIPLTHHHAHPPTYPTTDPSRKNEFNFFQPAFLFFGVTWLGIMLGSYFFMMWCLGWRVLFSIYGWE